MTGAWVVVAGRRPRRRRSKTASIIEEERQTEEPRTSAKKKERALAIDHTPRDPLLTVYPPPYICRNGYFVAWAPGSRAISPSLVTSRTARTPPGPGGGGLSRRKGLVAKSREEQDDVREGDYLACNTAEEEEGVDHTPPRVKTGRARSPGLSAAAFERDDGMVDD